MYPIEDIDAGIKECIIIWEQESYVPLMYKDNGLKVGHNRWGLASLEANRVTSKEYKH